MATPFHVGFVTQDLQAAMSQLGESAGVSWTTIRTESRSVWTPEGPQTVTFEGAYSTTGPTHLELIRAVDGSPWRASDDMLSIHHIGYWSNDMKQDSQRIVDSGLPIAAAGGHPDAPEHFVYFGLGAGGYMELLDVAAKPDFEAWWAGRE